MNFKDPKVLDKIALTVWTFDFFLLAHLALHYLGIIVFAV